MAERDRVLIAGAGPVGLSAAAALAAAGIPVLVLEAEDDLPKDLRASTFHPPTLDMLDRFGATARLIEQGLIAPTWQYRDREAGPIATFDLGVLEDRTAHPYRVQCEQWKLTRILRDVLADMDCAEIRYGHAATSAVQHEDGVTLMLETPDGPLAIEGRFVIAADGARSVVRKSQGIGFDGMTLPERFLVISTPYDFADDFPDLTYVNYFSDPEEWFVLLRVVDCWRVLIPTSADDSEEQILAAANAQAQLNGIVARDAPYPLMHRTLYRIHERVAERYRAGRVLLAGDAAHINNPLGGMGMNGGIHDAFNLAEKLIKVWHGGPDRLLDRYDRQRRAIAIEYVQAQALRNRAFLKEKDPALRKKGLDEMRRLADDPKACRDFLMRSSMLSSLDRANSID